MRGGSTGRPAGSNHPAGRALRETESSEPAEPRRLPTLRSVFGDDRVDEDSVDDNEDDLSETDDQAEIPQHRIEAISMRALGRRGLSRRELERTLRSHGVDDTAVETEVARLESVGLIDDVALAQNLVGVLQERKGLGRTGVAAELARRMLSPAAIEYALELVDSGDELARARELAAGRARQLRGLDRDTAVRRLSAWLARRGYSGSTVRSAVDAALGAPNAGATVRFR
jgi:regulatory protein